MLTRGGQRIINQKGAIESVCVSDQRLSAMETLKLLALESAHTVLCGLESFRFKLWQARVIS